MLNEAIEEQNLSNKSIEVLEISLSSRFYAVLRLYFMQVKRKRYLTKEEIYIVDTVLDNQVDLINLKVLLKKFAAGKFNKSHKNELFELVSKQETQNNKSYTISSLKYKKAEGIYLYDVDVETFLEIWREATLGYNKSQLNEYKKVFQANSTFSKSINKNGDIEYFTSGIFDSSDDFMKTIESELNSNTYDENKMKETLKNRKNKN